jgi:tetratricopeptide (TPR) repeat protein
VVEDIVAALSRFRGLAVVAAEEAPAGVRYRLRGTVGRRGERLRLTVKLIEAETGVHLWATQLEGPVDALFQFQETVAESVVGVVEPRIQRAEIERARRKRPDSLGAYDLYLRALPHFRGTTPEARAEAVRLLDLAVALDPGFATGLAHCAWAHERHDTFGVGLGPEERAATLAMAERAAELGHDDPVVCAIAGLVLLNLGDEPMRALAMLEEALQRSPNHSTVMSLCAFGNLMAGDVMRARQGYLKALAVSPEALDRYELLVGVALAELMLGEFEPALGWAGKSLAANPDWLGAHWAATSALGHLGREAEARAAVARLLARAPGMRIAHLQRLAARSPTRFAVIIDGLRKAGLPE